TSDSADPVAAGGTLIDTLAVTNAGPSDATGVTVTDTLPSGVAYTTGSSTQGSVSESSGTVTAVIGALASGQTETVTINVAVGAAATGTLTNTAVVVSNETETNVANNSDTEDTVVAVDADLSITKSDSPDPVVADSPLVYTIVVTNNGPSDATGVTVTDALPAGVTYDSGSADQGSVTESSGTVTANIGDIAVGDSVTVTLNVDVDPGTLGTITNAATVAGNEADSVSANNNASESTTVQPEIDLVITKVDSVDPAVAGQTLTYTVGVTNNGPSDATSVVVTDVLPAGVSYQSGSTTQGSVAEASGTVTATIGNLASGATATVTIQVLVAASTTGTLINTAQATGAETESNAANNTASENTTIDRETDLAIAKTAVPDPVAAGNSLAYTIVVTNNGPSDASGVTVTDILPGDVTFGSGSSTVGSVTNSSGTVTGTIGDLAVGASATVTINVDVNSIVVADITNTATVAGNETDLITANNSASVATSINLDPASVNGRVFIDRDNDGIFNNIDIALNNVNVRLTGTDVRGASVDTTLQTDANGLYSFTNLVPGDYTLIETQPTAFPDGQSILGSPAIGTSVPNEIRQLLLGPGVDVIDVVFTELVPTISKRNFIASSF
ncbi:MAG: putative repeat protein (TIGR01451 family), partial [Pirellulaceae bacterium]